MSDITLSRQQAAAEKAGERMLQTLLGFTPCRDLTVADVKFIAEWARTLAFDAIKEATE